VERKREEGDKKRRVRKIEFEFELGEEKVFRGEICMQIASAEGEQIDLLISKYGSSQQV
jgi:hypothetical protein